MDHSFLSEIDECFDLEDFSGVKAPSNLDWPFEHYNTHATSDLTFVTEGSEFPPPRC